MPILQKVIPTDEYDIVVQHFFAGEEGVYTYDSPSATTDEKSVLMERWTNGNYLKTNHSIELNSSVRISNVCNVLIGDVEIHHSNLEQTNYSNKVYFEKVITTLASDGYSRMPVENIVYIKYVTDTTMYCFIPKTTDAFRFFPHMGINSFQTKGFSSTVRLFFTILGGCTVDGNYVPENSFYVLDDNAASNVVPESEECICIEYYKD